MLKEWNVVVVAESGSEKQLLESLSEDGDFRRSGFRDVLVGLVPDISDFLEEAESGRYRGLSRVIPVEDTFFVSPDNLIDILKKKIERYIDEIEPGDTFAVRVERRGMKEDISGRVVEREVGGYLYDLIERIHSKKPKVDLKNPDKLIVIEIIGNRCGVGFITREMREKYSVIRVK
ncbi:MAG: THUMP domain-containing protein [Canidatus Methanoxibalbensis ujae]|nr:THUMP domain-containing protein [Candidatus Methanoxibalbensis ujae]MCW7078923.1 THUMP domain-containing protein [Candidatus Methanoxibalbensis ujae]